MTTPLATARRPRAAVVTGADSGIGATAVRLAAAGLDVGITWHTDEEGARATCWSTTPAPAPPNRSSTSASTGSAMSWTWTSSALSCVPSERRAA